MANWRELDPDAVNEAQKYDNPVPSRTLILKHLNERGAPAGREKLAEEFGLMEEDQLEALRRRLRAMERDGQLIYTRRGAYAPVDKLDLICGRISGHRDGFGFFIPDDGGDDLYLSPAQMRLAFDGDRALARVSGQDRRGRPEGTLVEIIERAHPVLVGRFYEEQGLGYVEADNRKIKQSVLVPPGKQGKALSGQFVQVRIDQWPTLFRQAQGEVVEVLGDYMAPGMEIEVALRSYGIPYEWPQAVLKETAKLSPSVAEKDKARRVDLRDLPLVTIDGEDARDFDDAVYAEARRGGGWTLIVAIADVSHYVRVGSALDQEAQSRGNSVYFPMHVVPMLPEELSNGLCSLNPEVDRLTLACEMTISKSGRMTGYCFYEAVICSHSRLTYNEVSSLLEKPTSAAARKVRQQRVSLVEPLRQLYALYKVLLAARSQRGAIDFETQETRIVYGPDRKIADILPTQRNDAHRLIEECMLCANVAAARFLQELDLPALYRVHAGPTPEKLEKLRGFLAELGLSLFKGRGDPTPKDYLALLESIRERPDFQLIQTVMLRSLSQAHYTAENEGHFGLNYEAYTHFTSPIRRYPDLLVHRAIRSVIRSKQETDHVRRAGAGAMRKAEIYPYDEAHLDKLGEGCSLTERRADEATRDVISWLKCEYMQERIGETFAGIISGVTNFGLFIELTDIYVEGLVHITALPGDYYFFDAVHHRLSGERSGRVFRLGDRLTVQVARVDLDSRQIDFELAGEKGKGAAVGRKERANPGSDRNKGRQKSVRSTSSEQVAPELLQQADALLQKGVAKGASKGKGATQSEPKTPSEPKKKVAATASKQKKHGGSKKATGNKAPVAKEGTGRKRKNRP